MEKLGEQGNPQSMIHWTSLVRNNTNEFTFSDYIDNFLYRVSFLLNSDAKLRIGPEIKRILHLSEQTKIGDWYLYQDYTNIRVYGCELLPYKSPKFVPIRIFALEYVRKMINMDEMHFVSTKKKSEFKIKTQAGHFSSNARTIEKVGDVLLKQMKFKLNFSWSYDPLGIVSNLRVEQKTTPYAHNPRLEIEQYMNQDEWQENTLQEAEEHVLSSTASQTPVPQEKKDKTMGKCFPSSLVNSRKRFTNIQKEAKK